MRLTLHPRGVAEVLEYPASQTGRQLDASVRLTTPLCIATRLGRVSFIDTTTVFGTPNELLFPADEETVDVVNA